MKRFLIVASIVALTGCGEQETWDGALLASNWGDLPLFELNPVIPSSGAWHTQEDCEKGMLALRNRWYLWATNLAQVQGDAVNARLRQGWVDAEHPQARTTGQLRKDIEAANIFRDSVKVRCLLIEYEPAPLGWLERLTGEDDNR